MIGSTVQQSDDALPGISKKFFRESNVTYFDQPYQTFVNLQNGTIDYSYFEKYKNQLIIINFSSEHWANFGNYVYEQLDKTNLNFLILTYDCTNHQQYPRMFYFPYWYYWSKKNFNYISSTGNRNYYLGCLNHNLRTHRILNFLKLQKKSYWDKSCVSCFNPLKTAGGQRSDELQLSDDEFNQWEEIRLTLPTTKKMLEAPVFGHLNLPQLTDCYLHLVTETTISPGVFTTEKTWKPIASAVPFLIYGNLGTMSFLKSQGVDTYDDIIDHKYYDTEEDARKRLDKLHKVIDDLILQGVDKLYNQLFDRAIINQKKFFNGEFDQTYLPTLINAIKQYK